MRKDLDEEEVEEEVWKIDKKRMVGRIGKEVKEKKWSEIIDKKCDENKDKIEEKECEMKEIRENIKKRWIKRLKGIGRIEWMKVNELEVVWNFIG